MWLIHGITVVLLFSLGHDLHNVCTECKKEAKHVVANAERAVLVSEEEKDRRLNPSSNYPLSKLSLSDRVERISRLKKERVGYRRKLSKFVETTSMYITVMGNYVLVRALVNILCMRRCQR